MNGSHDGPTFLVTEVTPNLVFVLACAIQTRRIPWMSWRIGVARAAWQPAATQGLRFGGRWRAVVLRAEADDLTPSRSAGRQAKVPVGTVEPRGRSAHPERQRGAARLREQTRLPRRRRFCSCRGRSRLETSLSPDAGTQRTWWRDTKPCPAGWRFAQLPASTRSKRELLETREAHHS